MFKYSPKMKTLYKQQTRTAGESLNLIFSLWSANFAESLLHGENF